MTNIFESPSWEDDIQLIGRTERVSGGQDGVANRPLKQLANRTRYLKEKYDDIDLSGKIEAVKNFLEGGTLTSPREEILYGNYRMVWTGDFPKTVPPGSSPSTTGGTGAGGWAYTSDAALRQGMASPDGTRLMHMPVAGNVGDVLDWYSLDSFGLEDGADVTAALLEIVALQKKYGFTLKQRQKRTFILSGDQDIVFYGTCNFSGVKWVPENFRGSLSFTQTKSAVVYDASTQGGALLLSKINGTDWRSRDAQSSKLSGLVSDTTLDNHFVIFKSSSVVLYSGRGKNKTWIAMSRVSKKGKLDRALKYPMPASVDSVYALPVSDGELFISPGCFDMKNQPHTINIFFYDISRATIENPTVINRPLTDNGSAVDLSIDGGYKIKFRNVYSPWPNDSYNSSGSRIYSYTLNYNNVSGLHISDSVSQGEGWGATAGENCQDVTFDNVDFNRIDFHNPFWGSCHIFRSHLGNFALSICGVGDVLSIRDSTITLESGQEDAGVIKGRDDQGGFNDCHLEIDGLVINGDPGNRSALIRANSDGTGGVPDGSPVTPWMFKTVTLRNIRWGKRLEGSRFDSIFSSNTDGLVYFPRKVLIENCDYLCGDTSDNIGFAIDFKNFRQDYDRISSNAAPTLSAGYTSQIEFHNIDVARMAFKGAGVAHNPRVVVFNAMNSRKGENAPPLNLTQRGTYEFYGCDFQYIDYSYQGQAANGTIQMKMHGGTVRCPSGLPVRNSDDNHTTDLHGVSIMADFDGAANAGYDIAKNLARYALMTGCQFYRASGERINYLTLWTGAINTTETSFDNFYVRAGNCLEVQCLFDSRTMTDTLKISNTAGYTGRMMYSGSVTAGYRLSVSAAGNKAKINSGYASASVRQISLRAE